MTTIQFRQGDVFITKTTMPDAAKKAINKEKDRVVLAYGEVTGHAHAISTLESTRNVAD